MKIEPRPAWAPKWYVFNKNLIENQGKPGSDPPGLQNFDLARTLLSGAQGPGPRAGDPIGP